MSSTRHKVAKLINRDGPHCHYCFKFLCRSQGTLDHVVPKSFGGPNCLDNYVLACSDCNEIRGTSLNWCDCDFCGPLIEEYLSSDKYFEFQFFGLMRYNKPVVRYSRRNNAWRVYLYPYKNLHPQHISSFRSWGDAIQFALTYAKEPARVVRY